jgi:hypothetical protein
VPEAAILGSPATQTELTTETPGAVNSAVGPPGASTELQAWERVTTAELSRRVDALLAATEATQAHHSIAGPAWVAPGLGLVPAHVDVTAPLSQPFAGVGTALAQALMALSTMHLTAGSGDVASGLATIPGHLSAMLGQDCSAVSALRQLVPPSIVFAVPQPPG